MKNIHLKVISLFFFLSAATGNFCTETSIESKVAGADVVLVGDVTQNAHQVSTLKQHLSHHTPFHHFRKLFDKNVRKESSEVDDVEGYVEVVEVLKGGLVLHNLSQVIVRRTRHGVNWYRKILPLTNLKKELVCQPFVFHPNISKIILSSHNYFANHHHHSLLRHHRFKRHLNARKILFLTLKSDWLMGMVSKSMTHSYDVKRVVEWVIKGEWLIV